MTAGELWRHKRKYICGIIMGLAVYLVVATFGQGQGSQEDTHNHRLFPCMEDGLRSSDTGCQLLAKMKVSKSRACREGHTSGPCPSLFLAAWPIGDVESLKALHRYNVVKIR
jgi:hypothetical protein